MPEPDGHIPSKCQNQMTACLHPCSVVPTVQLWLRNHRWASPFQAPCCNFYGRSAVRPHHSTTATTPPILLWSIHRWSIAAAPFKMSISPCQKVNNSKRCITVCNSILWLRHVQCRRRSLCRNKQEEKENSTLNGEDNLIEWM